MTTEEKAKAYDRALEKARMYHDNAKAVKEYAAVARYEIIFPELHEEEKPLTPFQQCLSRILYKVYYASALGGVDKFIMGTIKRYTDELVELAKKHEYTDCKLSESEEERVIKAIDEIMKSRNAWEVAEKHGLTAGDIRRWVIKQKEQKPSEPSDEELQRHQDELYDFKVFAAKQAKEHHISFVHDFEWNNFCAELLSYFHEQKPVLTAKEAWKEMRLEVYAQASGNRHEPNYSDDSTKMFSLCDIDEIFEKIGNSTVEQKPAEKQDYSGLNDPERAILRGFLAAGIRNVPVGIIKETAKDCIAHFPWPTKWSKEDENTINKLCNIIASNSKKGYLGRYYAGDLVQKLKSLRPQPKQEWSEEDADMLNCCISSIEEAKENRYAYKETDGDTSYDREIAWLKSLRPSWKPSDHQMNILKNE